MKRIFVLLTVGIFLLTSILHAQQNNKTNYSKEKSMQEKIQKTEKEWKELLTAEQFYILREKGTERPFTGKYWNFDEQGVYKCAACGVVLFTSETKFDSECGWPSFYDVVNNKNVITKDDFSFGMNRIEVMCADCGGHLGHLFDDGPKPTGQRYCINSVALKFEKKGK